MTLAEMIEVYEDALARKDDLAEQTKANNQAIKDLKEKIGDELVEQNKTEECQGDYKYTLDFKRDWSFKSEAALAAEDIISGDKFELLESLGMEEFITRQVNTKGLSKEINERLDREEPIPEELEAALTCWEHNDIGRRKLTAKQKKTLEAAKAAKGGN